MHPGTTNSRRALVAGAGGFLGGAIVSALAEDGWEVRALVHRPSARRPAPEKRVSVLVGDVLDPAVLDRASRGCDLIVHVAAGDPSRPEGFHEAERVRVEGCRNLLRAARTNSIRRFVLGSGYWVYADNPGTITEESPIDPRGESLINRNAELAALDAEVRGPVEVLVVRPGMVYGDGSWFRAAVQAIGNGSYRYVGDGSNAWSFVSRPDAGSGFARVAESGEPGEVYNLVDGRPAAWKEFGDFVADRLSRPRPGSVTPADAVSEYGADVTYHLRARRACSAAKIERLGWKPGDTTFREGLSNLLPRWVGAPPGGPAGP